MATLKFLGKPLYYLLFALLLIAGQAAVLDYYLVTFNRKQFGLGYGWLGWVAADIVVLGVNIALYVIGRRYINQRIAVLKHRSDDPKNQESEFPSSKLLPHTGILPYAWLGWWTYSAVLVGKVIAIFKTFGTHLLETDHLGINTMEFIFGASAAVFMLFVGGLEHLATDSQKHYIRWMQHYVLLEIVDCVEFLTSLFVAAEVGHEEEKRPLPEHMQNVILAFACINLLAPAHALYRLSRYHNRHRETHNRFFLTQTLIGTLFGNIPYFVVRVMLWHDHSYITGLFAMKNLIGILTDGQELVEFFHEYRKGEKEREGSDDGSGTGGWRAQKFSVGSPAEKLELQPRNVQQEEDHLHALVS